MDRSAPIHQHPSPCQRSEDHQSNATAAGHRYIHGIQRKIVKTQNRRRCIREYYLRKPISVQQYNSANQKAKLSDSQKQNTCTSKYCPQNINIKQICKRLPIASRHFGTNVNYVSIANSHFFLLFAS